MTAMMVGRNAPRKYHSGESIVFQCSGLGTVGVDVWDGGDVIELIGAVVVVVGTVPPRLEVIAPIESQGRGGGAPGAVVTSVIVGDGVGRVDSVVEGASSTST